MNKILIKKKNNIYNYNYFYINYEIDILSISLELKRKELIKNIKNILKILLDKYNIDVNNVFPRWLMLQFNTKSYFFIDPIIPYINKNIDNKQLIKDIYYFTNNKQLNVNQLLDKMNLKNKCNNAINILKQFIKSKDYNKKEIVIITKNNNFYYLEYENYKYRLHEKVYNKLHKLYKLYNNVDKDIDTLIFCLIIRYDILESYNQQLAVNLEFYNYLKINYNVNFELFASPLNCFFDNYCSLFYDIEKYFNSQGNFRNIRLNKGFYVANPPYDEHIMYKMTLKILKRLYKTKFDLSFIIIIPGWTDTEYLELLKKSQYLIDIIKVEKKKAKFFDYYLYKIIYPCDIFIILLQNKQGKEKYNINLKKTVDKFYH